MTTHVMRPHDEGAEVWVTFDAWATPQLGISPIAPLQPEIEHDSGNCSDVSSLGRTRQEFHNDLITRRRKGGKYELQSKSDCDRPDHLVPAIFGSGFWRRQKCHRNDKWARR